MGYKLAYKYSFISTKSRWFSKNSTCYNEPDERFLEFQANYDVFQFPEDKEYLSETIPKSILFYLKWLLQFVDLPSFTKILTEIDSFRFITLSPKHEKECLKWIVEIATACNVPNIHGLYLCIVLSHFSSGLDKYLVNDGKTASACDCLLQCLDACVDSVFLSQSNREHLKKIAVILVQHSSTPNWLTFAAHFYPFLGVEFILNTYGATVLKWRYEGKEYRKKVDTLFSTVRITNDLATHKDLLYFVLESAPTLVDGLELFEDFRVCQLFTNEDERAQIFVEFYKNRMRSRDANTTQGSVSVKLAEFYNIPEKLRGRMHKLLLQILLEYAKSDDQLNDEHVKAFVNSLISEYPLYNEQVSCVLKQLSKSKSVLRQKVLLDILNNERFVKRWRETSWQCKVDICKSWVITTVVNTARDYSFDEVSKVATAYKAIDEIMKCSLNYQNKTLVEHVSDSLVSTILREEKVVPFIQAFVSVGECSEIVQRCYKSHVRTKLTNASKAEKIKSSMQLKECSGSRYIGFRILYQSWLIFLPVLKDY